MPEILKEMRRVGIRHDNKDEPSRTRERDERKERERERDDRKEREK